MSPSEIADIKEKANFTATRLTCPFQPSACMFDTLYQIAYYKTPGSDLNVLLPLFRKKRYFDCHIPPGVSIGWIQLEHPSVSGRPGVTDGAQSPLLATFKSDPFH